MIGCVHLPPSKITRKLIRFIVAYLLCMATSLMMIHWAMSQLPSPDALSKASSSQSPDLVAVWSLPRCSSTRVSPLSLLEGNVMALLCALIAVRPQMCRSFDDLHKLQKTLEAYRAEHFPQLLRAFCFLYLFMQCFTVPGCFFLTVLLGSLLPHAPATVVATVLITCGCVLNFQLSRYIISDVMLHFIPDRIRRFQQAVANQGPHNLFSYMLFLRVIAVLPSWMVNLASPLAKVPLSTFVTTTVVGFQPQVCIKSTALLPHLVTVIPACCVSYVATAYELIHNS